MEIVKSDSIKSDIIEYKEYNCFTYADYRDVGDSKYINKAGYDRTL